MKSFLIVVGSILLIIGVFFTTPPFSYPTNTIVSVQEGSGLYTLSQRLKDEKVVRSPFWFRAAAIIFGGERDMKAGEYYLSRPENVSIIAWRILHGLYDIETVKLTIPEGFTVSEIAELFDERFEFFNHKDFLALAPEGYLFPDTYFFPLIITASSTIKMMRDNFGRHVPNGVSRDILIMASLLEAEVKSKTDREIVSGILWKRLSINMPLQVDSELGTYKYTGLPEKPINNPGLISIQAALHPATTPYLYFLTDKDGNAHYSKTFDEHKLKKAKYLNR